MIKFAVKAGLAASAVYYVREQGVWKDSKEAIESAKKLQIALSPYVQEVTQQIPFELPKMPETENSCQLAKEYWNAGVRATFRFLVQLPDCTKAYAKNGIDALLKNPEIKKFVDSVSTPPDSKTEKS